MAPVEIFDIHIGQQLLPRLRNIEAQFDNNSGNCWLLTVALRLYLLLCSVRRQPTDFNDWPIQLANSSSNQSNLASLTVEALPTNSNPG